MDISPERFEGVELASDGGVLEATFVPHAGMLGWSLRHRGEELLAHPVSLEEYVNGGHVTALPLLHPWANRLASPTYEIAGRHVSLDMDAPDVHTDPNGLPIHGLLAGYAGWEVVDRQPSLLRARLDFASRPELMRGFPFAHELELSVKLTDAELAVEVKLTPTGDSAVPVAFGFHPYLALPGLPRREWHVELPVTRRMLLDERMLPTGRTEPVDFADGPLGERTFDDGFDELADNPEFVIAGAGRRVSLCFLEGYRFAQVYAPEASEFICFEPMTAPVDPFADPRTEMVEPGSVYVARFAIAVEE